MPTPSPESLELTAAAMRAKAAGKQFQFRDLGDKGRGWVDGGAGLWINRFEEYEYRPKPEPKRRPWSKPEDVPGPGQVWIRANDAQGFASLFVGTSPEGIYTFEPDKEECFVPWRKLSTHEYSLDRKTWHPCTVEEPEA